MASPASSRFSVLGLPLWSVILPFLALAALTLPPATGLAASLSALVLGGTVLAAVHHAEVVAARTGEPFGTIILAIAVTIIEVSLIVSIMLSDGEGARALARDTVFAVLMIVLNGIIGLCLLIGGSRHHEQSFTQYGVSAGLAMLATLATLTLVLPNYTSSAAGPVYSATQLGFVGVVSLLIYGVYVFGQTLRHRTYFLPQAGTANDTAHSYVPAGRSAIAAFVLLLVALAGVVLLAKQLSPAIKDMVTAIGAPPAFVGIIIAALVLLPESLAAVRAAAADRLQTSLNLAIGSALATIGLTIPVVAVVALLGNFDLVLGLSDKSILLLTLTLFVASLSLGTGRTTILQGAVHLVIFAVFLFTTLVP